jgi:hypothetical protein
MKEKDARVNNKHQLVLYVEQEDGTYGPIQTGSYMVEHYFDDYLEKHKRLEADCLAKLCDGEISPIGYYMTLINISEADIGSRVNISARKVRNHKDPKHFAKIGLPLVKRYAEVFGVPVANMFQILTPKNPETKICQQKTQNPLVVITKV